ncbi:MAG: hypothetical protein WKF94_08400 [Solirubrobacteraceae bacterium]
MLTDTVSFLLAPTIAAALAAAPYPVSTPVLDPLKLCYVTVQTGPETFETESVRVAGSRFTPNSVVDVKVNDKVVVSGALVDGGGNLPAGFVASPPVLNGERPFTLTATERGEGGASIALESLASTLSVRVKPQRARPSDKVRLRGRGFTARGGIYAHYLLRGKLRRTVRLAKAASGACGSFDVRVPQFPFKPKQGTWRLQIDQQRRLSDEGPLINLTIDVRRRPRV